MKTQFNISLFVVSSLLLISGISMGQSTDEAKKDEKVKRLKMVKIVDGEKTVLDTLIYGNTGFKWDFDGNFPFEADSALKGRFHRFEMDGPGRHRKMLFMSPDEREFVMRGFAVSDKDSLCQLIRMRRHDGPDGMDVMKFRGEGPRPPAPPHVVHFRAKGNVIDLDEPGMISYRKKDLSGGREKIEIIRKKPADTKDKIVIE
ncbi:hypothetical protein [Gaoshiqia sp. Z1-71]|uniref:hypothetical protein n=1 Tax=Gaoshiqia hydrogeniformans TaxID=3290090 RepID=UPI003BF77EAB